jgi:uncharacterized protein YjbI with pentapeptide repeats
MSETNSQQMINTAVTLLERYAEGNRNFSEANLGDADLQGVDLKGSDLSYADLSEANLNGANLRGCYLSFANLSQANLQDADLGELCYFRRIYVKLTLRERNWKKQIAIAARIFLIILIPHQWDCRLKRVN